MASLNSRTLVALLLAFWAAGAQANDPHGSESTSPAGPVIVLPTSVAYTFSSSDKAKFDGVNVATLTIQAIGSDTKWTLSSNWDSRKYASAFLFGIDFEMEKKPVIALFKADNGVIGLKSVSKNGIKFNGSNSPSNSAGRFDSGEQASWSFTNTRVSDFNALSAHVNAIDHGASVKFGAVLSPVPEPDSYAMLLIGLGLLGFSGRKRSCACF